MKAVKIYLEEEHYERLRQLAEARGLSLSAMAREILLRGLGVEPMEDRMKKLEEEVKRIKDLLNKLVSNYNALVKDYKHLRHCITEELLRYEWYLRCK